MFLTAATRLELRSRPERQGFCRSKHRNQSYGATICAERSAVLVSVADGEQQVGIYRQTTTRGRPGSAFWMCLQVLAEFIVGPTQRCIFRCRWVDDHLQIQRVSSSTFPISIEEPLSPTGAKESIKEAKKPA
jgi:hypothetical protein